MSQNYIYPSDAAASNPSVGPNGDPIPTSAQLIGGENPSGDLTPIQTDADGNIIVGSSALPTGASTEAKQDAQITLETAGNASLSSIDTKTPALVSGRVPVDVQASVLPTGAATEASLGTANTTLSTISSTLTSGVIAKGNTATVTGIVTAQDQDLFPSQDVSAYAFAYLQMTGTFSGTISFQGSNDNSTFVSVFATRQNSSTQAPGGLVSTTVQNGIYVIPLTFKYLRVRCTTYGSGTSNGTTVLTTSATTPAIGQSVQANQAGTWVVNLGGDNSNTLATSALQTTGNASLASIDAKNPALVSGRVPVDPSGVTSPISAASLPLPTGAATEATLAAASAKLPATLGQKTMANSLAVTLASDQSAIPTASAGKSKSNTPILNNYASTPVTSAAYVQLVASTTSAASVVEIFDSSGETLYLAVGAAASEVDQLIIIPGGNGQVPLAIPAGSRISVKATSTSATVGSLVINLYG